MRAGRAAGLVAAAALGLPGCSFDCGSDVYPDLGEMSVRMATATTHDNVGPPLPFEVVAPGDGRVVVYGRRVRLRAWFHGPSGEPLGQGEATVLFPPAERPFGGLDPGEMPVYFGPVLGGMRVGERRRFVMPEHHGDPVEPWRLRGMDQPRYVEVPATTPVRVELEVLDACKPRVCLQSTYSIPSSREQRLTILGCS